MPYAIVVCIVVLCILDLSNLLFLSISTNTVGILRRKGHVTELEQISDRYNLDVVRNYRQLPLPRVPYPETNEEPVSMYLACCHFFDFHQGMDATHSPQE
jgi:hypothetical protein